MTAATFLVRQKRGSILSGKSLSRALCAEYMHDFDLARVATMFNTDIAVVRRVVNSNEMQRHLSMSLGDTSKLDAIASRRLVEALLAEAFQETPATSEKLRARTEARKILARHYMPKRVETSNTHRYFVETPQKLSDEEWQKRYGGIQEADYEVIGEDGRMTLLPADKPDDSQ